MHNQKQNFHFIGITFRVLTCILMNINGDHSQNFFRQTSLLYYKLYSCWRLNCWRWLQGHVNILYKCSFNMNLWCCVPGCSNSEGGHKSPKTPQKLKLTVTIQRLDPSTDSGQKYSDTSNIPYIFHIKL